MSLILYTKPGCPFCATVLHAVDELGIQIDERSISEEEHREALVEHGGKQQVPYLIDTERDVSMYESEDISEYLQKHYGDGGEADASSDESANTDSETKDAPSSE